MKSTIIKHSVVINGHKTSVSLEQPFWNIVREIADAERMTVSALLRQIDEIAPPHQPVVGRAHLCARARARAGRRPRRAGAGAVLPQRVISRGAASRRPPQAGPVPPKRAHAIGSPGATGTSCMTESLLASPAAIASPLRPWYLVAAGAAVAVLIAAILGRSLWFLNFVHVMTGALWTGIDLFMGFVVGPVLRRVSLDTRRAMIAGIIPRTLVLMPTLSIVTSTAGWFLAGRLGFLDLGYPQFWWVIAALAIVTVLTIQGLGYLLPTNLRLYFEIQKARPRPRQARALDAHLCARGRHAGLHAGRNHCGDGAFCHRTVTQRGNSGIGSAAPQYPR